MTELQARQSGILRPRARLVHTLGSDLISSERVALIELVKNAYDADASKVVLRFNGPLEEGAGSVEVWDNGHGMSFDTVRKVWSEIATPHRRAAMKSESGNRRVLGEKGIGRLAASRIGNRTEITTRRANAPEVEIGIDWRKFNEDVYLDQVTFPLNEGPAGVFADGLGEAASVLGDAHPGSGTVVRMKELKSSWEENDIRQLRLALSRLAGPVPSGELDEEIEPDFEISLELPSEFRHLSGVVEPSDLLMHPHYSICGEVNGDGVAELVYEELISGTASRVTKTVTVLSRDRTARRAPACGPLKVDIRAWDLDKTAFDATRGKVNFKSTDIKDYRTEIKEHSGVGLYRDKFRVQPFGDPTYDWLNLDARRVNNPTTRLSNNQISGFIFISADQNDGLRDRSHREGLIDTHEYEDLQSVVLSVIEELEIRRRNHRKKQKGASTRDRPREGGLFSDFSLDSLHELSRLRSNDPELKKAVKEVEASVQAGIQNVKEALSRFSRLATLGSVVDIVLHEGRGAVGRIKTSALVLAKAAQMVDDHASTMARIVKTQAPGILTGADTLTNLFKRIEPLSGRRRGRPRRTGLTKLVDSACGLLEPEFARLDIAVTRRVHEEIVTVDEGEIMHVLVNLLDNACYWLTHVDKSQRKILIEAGRVDDGNVVFRVSDSGPGVPPEAREEIFEAYYSRKPDGTGLGLAIAGSTVQDFYDGSLELIPSKELPGASFQVTLRRRVGE
ncbi:sensor histidine kinase [Arthrobacter sp. NyZ413]|uniref:sensor histidine kinase n=1 Tax=Arthrobacter sp. NyZ413 TaxID=3144669 RepID=UPI003BF8578D